MNQDTTRCSIEQCGNRVLARKMCSMHYGRWRRTGDPGPAQKQRKARGAECEVDGCVDPQKSRGLCENHYFSWRTYGDPMQAKRNKAERAQTATVCTVDGCNKDPRRKGMCGAHHHRYLKYGDPLGAPAPKTIRLCGVEGCENKHRCSGYCQKHYARFRSTGDPLGTKPRYKRPRPLCTLDGCPDDHEMHGYCKKHAYSFLRYGDPRATELAEKEKNRLIAEGKRVCSRCKVEQRFDAFPRNPSNKTDGLYSYCKECTRQDRRAYYERNREQILARGAEWRARNPGKANEKYMANRDLYLENAKRRKANLRGDGSERGITVKALRDIHGDKCCYCGKNQVFNYDGKYHPDKATLEHVLPLSRGGAHTFDNCRLACYSCNLQKNNKTVEEWDALKAADQTQQAALIATP